MKNPLTSIIHWGIDMFTSVVEYFAGLFGRFVGVFLARMWGPIIKYGSKHYSDEMARFIPEIIIHLQAMNDMLLTIMQDTYKVKAPSNSLNSLYTRTAFKARS